MAEFRWIQRLEAGIKPATRLTDDKRALRSRNQKATASMMNAEAALFVRRVPPPGGPRRIIAAAAGAFAPAPPRRRAKRGGGNDGATLS
jgi:hypothetical protein